VSLCGIGVLCGTTSLQHRTIRTYRNKKGTTIIHPCVVGVSLAVISTLIILSLLAIAYMLACHSR
jgi:hypothetical protein